MLGNLLILGILRILDTFSNGIVLISLFIVLNGCYTLKVKYYVYRVRCFYSIQWHPIPNVRCLDDFKQIFKGLLSDIELKLAIAIAENC